MSANIMDKDVQIFSAAIAMLNATMDKLNNSIGKNMHKTQECFESWQNNTKTILSNNTDRNSRQQQFNSTPKSPEELEKERLALRDKTLKNPRDMEGALASAGYRIEDDFGNTFKNIQGLIYSSSISMRDNMNNFFFDAMAGKLKDAEEYFRSFLTSIQKAIAQFLANEITSKLI